MHFSSVAIRKITFLKNLSKFDYTFPTLKKSNIETKVDKSGTNYVYRQ